MYKWKHKTHKQTKKVSYSKKARDKQEFESYDPHSTDKQKLNKIHRLLL